MDETQRSESKTESESRSAPQGVVVAVFINMVNVSVSDVADQIARVFNDVDFDLWVQPERDYSNWR